MDEQVSRSLKAVTDFKGLVRLEKNVRERINFDEETATAFADRGQVIARGVIADRTGLDLRDPTPAEEKIIHAVSAYLSIKLRDGTNANRTIDQIRNRGLIEAAEVAVSKARPTQGYETLHREDRDDLSYEQIVVDHSEEFSPRALWFSRRTLGLDNKGEKPPASASIPAQIRTEELLGWLGARAAGNGGNIAPFTNAEAAAALGMTDMARQGRVFGNIQSRLDYACYRLGLPPLGLTAAEPFAEAWRQETRSWSFPVQAMQRAARSFQWQPRDFEKLVLETRSLPGQAHLLWKEELNATQGNVRDWAEGLEGELGQTTTGQADERVDTDAVLELHDEDQSSVAAEVVEVGASKLDRLAELEGKFLNASPEVRTRISRHIERGPIGAEVKRLNGFRCQLCEALGSNPVGFRKRNGEHYVEAHHVTPVARAEIGSLSAANIVTLCANHHRELHYGDVCFVISDHYFTFTINGQDVMIPRAKVDIPAITSAQK